MERVTLKSRRRLAFMLFVFEFLLLCLIFRIFYIQYFKGPFYQKLAFEQQTRDRLISPVRGQILDRNNTPIATSKSVSAISVIHAQVKEPEKVAKILSEKLDLDYTETLEKINKRVALMRIKTKVDKAKGKEIADLNLKGVVVDEDIQRIYPFNNLASHVIGFVGKDNQGIIGLEAKYEQYLKGEKGKILTQTDGRGDELKNSEQDRKPAKEGYNLVTTLDINLQQYAEQTLEKAVIGKNAKRGSVIMMNPQNGEILAMACKPDFNLNEPYKLNTTDEVKDKNYALNQMWRNFNINDTYEPGSTFKIITASAGLEEGVVRLTDQFQCPGYKMVEDRRIRCHKVGGHGTENFVQGIQNSCNPVFIELGLRIGVDRFCDYFHKFGLMNLTGVDIPGEAGTIMHKKENIGQVELATISFGQSFQITPIQLAATVSALINGGKRVTPHFGTEILNEDGKVTKEFHYSEKKHIVSEKTSETMRILLESVVSEGSGKNAYVEGYRIGGKTATSQTLPRSANKYISSFVGFAPADDPEILGMCVIYNPQGIYYGGTIAAPVIGNIFENILPYLGIEKQLEMQYTR